MYLFIQDIVFIKLSAKEAVKAILWLVCGTFLGIAGHMRVFTHPLLKADGLEFIGELIIQWNATAGVCPERSYKLSVYMAGIVQIGVIQVSSFLANVYYNQQQQSCISMQQLIFG